MRQEETPYAHFQVLNEHERLPEHGKVELKSRLFLYASNLFMSAVLIVMMLDSLDFFTPGQALGEDNWVTWFVFLGGVYISFLCVPILYWSSFDKFKKNDEFWDAESFWILPLFFFGSFYQYMSDLPYTLVTLPFSLILIFLVHVWVLSLSRGLITEDDQFENSARFFKSFTYLTAYYLIFAVAVVSFDLFGKFKYWIS